MNSQAYLRPIPASHTMQPQTPVSPEAPTFPFNPTTPRFPSSPVFIPSLSTGWVVTDAGDSKTSDPSDLKEPTVYFPASVYAEALFFFSEASKKTGEAAAFFLTEKIMPMHPQFMAYDFFIPGQSASPGDVDIYGSETLRYAEHFANTYPERFGKDVHRHLSHAHSHPGGSPSSWSGTDFTQQTEKTQMAKQSQYRIFLLWNEKSCMQASMWVYDPWAVKIAGKMRLGLYFGEGMGVVSAERKAFITQEIETKLHKKHVMGTFTGKGMYSHMREDFDYEYGVGGWHWDGRNHTPSSSAKPAKTAETKFAETIIPRSAVYPHPLTTQAGSSHVSAAEDFTRKLHAVLQDPTPAASAELPIEVGSADDTNDEYAKMIRSKAEQVVIAFFEEAWLNAEADPDYSGLDVAALTYKVFDLLKNILTDSPERPALITAKGFIYLMDEEALPIEYETALNAFLWQVEMAIDGSYEVEEPGFPGFEDEGPDGVEEDAYSSDILGFGNLELSEYFAAVNFDDQQEVAKAVSDLWEELHERFTLVA